MTSETRFDLHAVLRSLAQRRPVLRSRGDFDAELTTEIRLCYSEANVKVVKPFSTPWKLLQVRLGCEIISIKPRYHTARLCCILNGEIFCLKDHAAEDQARYDVLRDLMRIEQLVLQEKSRRGYVVFLTNDAKLWQPPVRTDPIDTDFRLHEGRELEGVLRWGAHAGAGTVKRREEPIALKGRYQCVWRPYFSLTPPHRNGEFRYLLFEVC